jgi:hypothetical protein
MILIFRGGMSCELKRHLSNVTDSHCAHDTRAHHQVASLDEDKRRFTLSFV